MHPEEETLVRFVERRTSTDEDSRIRHHLNRCDECLAVVGSIAVTVYGAECLATEKAFETIGTHQPRMSRWLPVAAAVLVTVVGFLILSGPSKSVPQPDPVQSSLATQPDPAGEPVPAPTPVEPARVEVKSVPKAEPPKRPVVVRETPEPPPRAVPPAPEEPAPPGIVEKSEPTRTLWPVLVANVNGDLFLEKERVNIRLVAGGSRLKSGRKAVSFHLSPDTDVVLAANSEIEVGRDHLQVIAGKALVNGRGPEELQSLRTAFVPGRVFRFAEDKGFLLLSGEKTAAGLCGQEIGIWIRESFEIDPRGKLRMSIRTRAKSVRVSVRTATNRVVTRKLSTRNVGTSGILALELGFLSKGERIEELVVTSTGRAKLSMIALEFVARR